MSAKSISTAIIATTGSKGDINERIMLAEIHHAIVKAGIGSIVSTTQLLNINYNQNEVKGCVRCSCVFEYSNINCPFFSLQNSFHRSV